MRDTRFGLIRLVLSVAVAIGAVLWPAPLPADDRTCPAGAPVTDPGIPSIFTAFTTVLNSRWAQEATAPKSPAEPIDPLVFQSGNQTASCPSDGGSACFFQAGLTNCLHADFHVNFSALTGVNGAPGLSTVKFSQLAVKQFNFKDVAEHSASGPDAGKITDGVFAPEGTEWNDTRYSVVLPTSDVRHALVIDLGAAITVCGGQGPSSCSNKPTIQADNNDKYQLDYSSNGTNWTTFGQFPTASDSHLRTRTLAGKDFTAQYVRVWAASGDGKYGVSELKLWNTAGQPVSLGKSAVGPRPYLITTGNPPANGTAWNDTRYAVVLAKDGPAHALVIDLGSFVNICGNGFACKSGPIVQADQNDVYQLDYSSDGVNWIKYGQFPTVSGGGLQTRGVAPITSGQQNPNFGGRYVRVWAVSGDGSYSVSQLTLWNTGSSIVSQQKLTSGPEPFVTNGELADDGTDWNDPRYATVLPICASSGSNSNSNSTCPAAGAKSAAVMIDLGASFSISQLNIQADQNDTYQIDASSDGASWTPLGTAEDVPGHGLTQRPITPLSSNPVRFLRVYATAGDGSYSVSALQVFTPTANTACSYDAGANALASPNAGPAAGAEQNLSCSYDGSFVTAVDLPPAGLLISFTLDEACGSLRCTNGTSDGSTPTECVKGAKCTAILKATQAIPQGTFCSGACASGGPSSLLTYAQLGENAIQFSLSQLSCDKSLSPNGADLHDAVVGVVQAATAGATQGLFDAFLTPPGLPSAVSGGQYVAPAMCATSTSAPPPNATLQGRASRVGTVTDAGSARVSGRFTAPHPIDLNRVSLIIDELLDEVEGVGELVRNVAGVPVFPIRLEPRSGSTPTAAIYQTPSGLRPNVRAEVKTRDPNRRLMEFFITVDRATLPTEPSSCVGSGPATTQLATRFGFEGPTGRVASANVAPAWRCLGTELATP